MRLLLVFAALVTPVAAYDCTLCGYDNGYESAEAQSDCIHTAVELADRDVYPHTCDASALTDCEPFSTVANQGYCLGSLESSQDKSCGNCGAFDSSHAQILCLQAACKLQEGCTPRLAGSAQEAAEKVLADREEVKAVRQERERLARMPSGTTRERTAREAAEKVLADMVAVQKERASLSEQTETSDCTLDHCLALNSEPAENQVATPRQMCVYYTQADKIGDCYQCLDFGKSKTDSEVGAAFACIRKSQTCDLDRCRLFHFANREPPVSRSIDNLQNLCIVQAIRVNEAAELPALELSIDSCLHYEDYYHRTEHFNQTVGDHDGFYPPGSVQQYNCIRSANMGLSTKKCAMFALGVTEEVAIGAGAGIMAHFTALGEQGKGATGALYGGVFDIPADHPDSNRWEGFTFAPEVLSKGSDVLQLACMKRLWATIPYEDNTEPNGSARASQAEDHYDPFTRDDVSGHACSECAIFTHLGMQATCLTRLFPDDCDLDVCQEFGGQAKVLCMKMAFDRNALYSALGNSKVHAHPHTALEKTADTSDLHLDVLSNAGSDNLQCFKCLQYQRSWDTPLVDDSMTKAIQILQDPGGQSTPKNATHFCLHQINQYVEYPTGTCTIEVCVQFDDPGERLQCLAIAHKTSKPGGSATQCFGILSNAAEYRRWGNGLRGETADTWHTPDSPNYYITCKDYKCSGNTYSTVDAVSGETVSASDEAECTELFPPICRGACGDCVDTTEGDEGEEDKISRRQLRGFGPAWGRLGDWTLDPTNNRCNSTNWKKNWKNGTEGEEINDSLEQCQKTCAGFSYMVYISGRGRRSLSAGYPGSDGSDGSESQKRGSMRVLHDDVRNNPKCACQNECEREATYSDDAELYISGATRNFNEGTRPDEPVRIATAAARGSRNGEYRGPSTKLSLSPVSDEPLAESWNLGNVAALYSSVQICMLSATDDFSVDFCHEQGRNHTAMWSPCLQRAAQLSVPFTCNGCSKFPRSELINYDMLANFTTFPASQCLRLMSEQSPDYGDGDGDGDGVGYCTLKMCGGWNTEHGDSQAARQNRALDKAHCMQVARNTGAIDDRSHRSKSESVAVAGVCGDCLLFSETDALQIQCLMTAEHDCNKEICEVYLMREGARAQCKRLILDVQMMEACKEGTYRPNKMSGCRAITCQTRGVECGHGAGCEPVEGGGYTCTCMEGFHGSPSTNKPSICHERTCQNADGWGTPFACGAFAACTNAVTQDGGVPGYGVTCTCKYPWPVSHSNKNETSLSNPETALNCPSPFTCEEGLCGYGASCQQLAGGYTCTCEQGFTGEPTKNKAAVCHVFVATCAETMVGGDAWECFGENRHYDDTKAFAINPSNSTCCRDACFDFSNEKSVSAESLCTSCTGSLQTECLTKHTCEEGFHTYDSGSGTCSATPCKGFTNQEGSVYVFEASDHFSANCAGKIAHGDACVLELSKPGYDGGSVTCNTTDGVYVVVAAGCADGFYDAGGRCECNNGTRWSAGEEKCAVNVCECENGKVPDLCPENDGNFCKSCDAGFHLLGATECVENVCGCKNGKVPDLCPENGRDFCKSCDPGYHLLGATECVVNVCACENGEAPDFCPEDEGNFCKRCDRGYHLPGDDDHECVVNVCECDNGTVIETCPANGIYLCESCDTGYALEPIPTGGKSCEDVDGCDLDGSNGCNGDAGATCSLGDGINQRTCTCDDGLIGTNATLTDAQNFGGCTDIDDCDSDPCQNGGTCTDGVDVHTCACVDGYSGLECDTDIDDCDPDPCKNGGTCTDGIDDYTCVCVDGYSGSRCGFDIARSEKIRAEAVRRCSAATVCANGNPGECDGRNFDEGQHLCESCSTGYYAHPNDAAKPEDKTCRPQTCTLPEDFDFGEHVVPGLIYEEGKGSVGDWNACRAGQSFYQNSPYCTLSCADGYYCPSCKRGEASKDNKQLYADEPGRQHALGKALMRLHCVPAKDNGDNTGTFVLISEIIQDAFTNEFTFLESEKEVPWYEYIPDEQYYNQPVGQEEKPQYWTAAPGLLNYESKLDCEENENKDQKSYPTSSREMVCKEKVCRCDNGEAVVGDACPLHDGRKCATCHPGYEMKEAEYPPGEHETYFFTQETLAPFDETECKYSGPLTDVHMNYFNQDGDIVAEAEAPCGRTSWSKRNDCYGTTGYGENYMNYFNRDGDIVADEAEAPCGWTSLLNRNHCYDCAGEANGYLKVDDCGVCNGDNECKDCLGVLNGDAEMLDCGCEDATSCLVEDCLGVPGGDAKVGACGCDDDSSCRDCSGVPNGGAEMLICGCEDATSCLDCLGVPNGLAKVEACGCGDDTSCRDCFGVKDGNSTMGACGCDDEDSCLDCLGKADGTAVMLACGCMDSDSCLDCLGTPDGDAKMLACGCDDDTSCHDLNTHSRRDRN